MSKKVEYVYVLTNKAFKEGWVKIGFSDDVGRRCKELRSTGIPTKFSIEYWVAVRNAQKLERAVHKLLAAHRINGDREFFDCGVDTAKEAIRTLLVGEASDDYDDEVLFKPYDEYDLCKNKPDFHTKNLYRMGFEDGKYGKPERLGWSQPYITGYDDGRRGKHNKFLPRPCDLVPDCRMFALNVSYSGEGNFIEGYEDRKAGRPPRYKYPSQIYCDGYNSTYSM